MAKTNIVTENPRKSDFFITSRVLSKFRNLSVNKPSVLTSTRLSFTELLDGILKNDRIILSRAITLVESNLPSDQKLAAQLLDACLPHTGKSIRIGVTGVPGVGKSTFIEAL